MPFHGDMPRNFRIRGQCDLFSHHEKFSRVSVVARPSFAEALHFVSSCLARSCLALALSRLSPARRSTRLSARLVFGPSFRPPTLHDSKAGNFRICGQWDLFSHHNKCSCVSQHCALRRALPHQDRRCHHVVLCSTTQGDAQRIMRLRITTLAMSFLSCFR